MKPIIRVESLSKQYYIGASHKRHDTIRDALASTLRRFGNRFSSNGRDDENMIWALKDVSFDVSPGEVVGIIGRNGAGKSTLLKILSRITEPTQGDIRLYGRVASLLEVGTGFHPDLTGRDNVFLNGAMLGMKRAEIIRKFDEIVDFAEIEKFIDTPVKHYSSGMYMRLAFAVAAHLNPEILIIDEVLAVGDAAFQRKCFGKIGSIAKDGRTVIFVSHNLSALVSLCQSGIWLDKGEIRSQGSAAEQAAIYTSASMEPPLQSNPMATQSKVSIKDVRVKDIFGNEKDYFEITDSLCIEFLIIQDKLSRPIRLVIKVRTASDYLPVLVTTDWQSDRPISVLDDSSYRVRCSIPGNILNSGGYYISVGVDEPGGQVHCIVENVRQFVIANVKTDGKGGYVPSEGVISPFRKWEVLSVQAHEKSLNQ